MIRGFDTDWKISGYVHPFVKDRYEINIAAPELDYNYIYEGRYGVIEGKVFDVESEEFDQIVEEHEEKLINFTFGIDIEKDLPKVIEILQNVYDDYKRNKDK